jgi:hypothetical protein
MRQELQRKVIEEKPSYSREEIQWLLEHLGDPYPEIRDELVFTSLARGIQEELFSLEQFQFISEEVSSDEGLYKEIDSRGVSALKRSFRALIYANLLSCDGTKESLYYQQLSSPIRVTMLNQGLHYFTKEKETTGYSHQFGWIHAFAHGADLLTEVICYPSFPKSDIAEAFEIIGKIFKRVEIRFTNDEDWRLARVLYEPILRGKIEPSLLTAWLQTVEFPLKEVNDFHKFSNFRSCLLETYLQLDCHKLLQDDLKEAIQSFQY